MRTSDLLEVLGVLVPSISSLLPTCRLKQISLGTTALGVKTDDINAQTDLGILGASLGSNSLFGRRRASKSMTWRREHGLAETSVPVSHPQASLQLPLRTQHQAAQLAQAQAACSSCGFIWTLLTTLSSEALDLQAFQHSFSLMLHSCLQPTRQLLLEGLTWLGN